MLFSTLRVTTNNGRASALPLLFKSWKYHGVIEGFYSCESKKISTNGIMWAVRIALTLLIWALQLLALLTVEFFAASCFGVALLLLTIPFWRWETALAVPNGFRALIIIMFVVIYCGASGAVLKKYTIHPKEVVIFKPTTSQPASATDISKPRSEDSRSCHTNG